VGKPSDDITVYQGIEFGTASRFEHSKPAPCWKGTLSATKLGPACFNFFSTPPQGASENCLNLNIYVPTKASSELLPVVFFVYGGGNEAGTNNDYNMENFARLMGDVIVVEPNYRLGVLGYMVHEPSSLYGNYGIGDLLTALEYVRPLLASFGGDASKITILGQSSGGTNILALLAAPRSVGLFRAAVSLSGSPNITMSVSDTSRLHTKYILPMVGCSGIPPSQVKQCLLSRSPANLTAGLDNIAGPPPSVNPPNLPLSVNGNDLIGLSIIDGVIVTKPLLEALTVPIVDVPVIIQTCQAEMDPAKEDVDHLPNVNAYASWLRSFLAQGKWGPSISEKLLDLYSKELGVTVELGFEAWVTDLGVTCGNDMIASTAAKSFKSPVYRTHLVAAPSHLWNDRTRYAFHTWDMPVTSAETWGDFVPQASDLALGAALRHMWREFAYSGVLSNEWVKDGCSTIGTNGTRGSCASSVRCAELERLGFDSRFWWVN